jgi:uncharacterized protein YndB with AHSA1/START domain
MTDENRRVIAAEIDIATPPPAVWNIFRDLEGWPNWNAACKEARWIDGASWHSGSTIEMVLAVGDELVTVQATLAEDDFPWLITFESSAEGLRFERKFELDYTGRKSMQIDTTTFAEGMDQAEIDSFRPGWEAMVRISLESLKVEVERVGTEGIWELTARRR